VIGQPAIDMLHGRPDWTALGIKFSNRVDIDQFDPYNEKEHKKSTHHGGINRKAEEIDTKSNKNVDFDLKTNKE